MFDYTIIKRYNNKKLTRRNLKREIKNKIVK
jgi:hypothetical protein